MPGRDLSSELFGSTPAPTSGGRDLSADLGLGSAKPLSRAEKFVKGLRDPIDAGAQLLVNLLPNSVVNAGNQLNNYLAEKTGLVAPLKTDVTASDLASGDTSTGVDRLIKQGEKEYQARRKVAGEEGIDAYRLAGNILNPANLAVASRLPQAASLAGRIGIGALGGGLSGGLTPVSEGDFTNEKLKQIGAGAAAGGLLPVLTGAASRLISPKASTNADLALLRGEGVQPTIGQALGGGAARAEEKLQSLPLVGDMVTNARKAANSSFESAAYNRALAPIGDAVPSGLKGRDALNYTENALSGAYDDVLSRIGAITPDAQFGNKVQQLQSMVGRLMIPAAEKQKFATALNDVQSSIDSNGVITSDIYKTLESSLASDARKLAGSQNIYEGKIAPAVQQLRAELQDMLQRQAGPAADELKAVNSAWANFKRVQRAAGSTGAENGEFSPAQFQAAVKALDKSKDKGAFARGSALGQDLSDSGKAVLGGKVPDSGTAGRLLLNGAALGGGAALSPTALLTTLGVGAAYLSPVQRALVSAVANRPASAQQAAELLRQSSPYLLPASGQLTLPLLQQ